MWIFISLTKADKVISLLSVSVDNFCKEECIFCLGYVDSQKEGSSKKETRRTSIESQQVGGEFAEFLKTLSKPSAIDISKQVMICINNLPVFCCIPLSIERNRCCTKMDPRITACRQWEIQHGKRHDHMLAGGPVRVFATKKLKTN